MLTELPRRARGRRLLLIVASAMVIVVAVVVALVLRAGDREPALLNESDFQGVTEVQNAGAPGWYSCVSSFLTDLRGGVTATSKLVFSGFDAVGATIYEAQPLHSTEDLLEDIRAQAAECAEGSLKPYLGPDDPDDDHERRSIVPLTDLDEGMEGWRIRDPSVQMADVNGVWGEVVAIPLDDTHLLRVGFETANDEPPVPREELIRLALEGVERVGLDEEPADD